MKMKMLLSEDVSRSSEKSQVLTQRKIHILCIPETLSFDLKNSDVPFEFNKIYLKLNILNYNRFLNGNLIFSIQ